MPPAVSAAAARRRVTDGARWRIAPSTTIAESAGHAVEMALPMIRTAIGSGASREPYDVNGIHRAPGRGGRLPRCRALSGTPRARSHVRHAGQRVPPYQVVAV